MEGNWGVYLGQQQLGKVQVLRQGLYYRFICRCQLTGDVVCRLWVHCGGSKESLGILVPMGDGFGLDCKLPVKRLGEGEPAFHLVPKHEPGQGKFIPIYPEEPFAYIERLKDGYLVRKDGQPGLMLNVGAITDRPPT